MIVNQHQICLIFSFFTNIGTDSIQVYYIGVLNSYLGHKRNLKVQLLGWLLYEFTPFETERQEKSIRARRKYLLISFSFVKGFFSHRLKTESVTAPPLTGGTHLIRSNTIPTLYPTYDEDLVPMVVVVASAVE